MNAKEFKEWLADHCIKFPQLSKWFKEQPAGKAATVDAWFQTLKGISLRAAQGASARMHGNSDLSATFPSQHPAKIRELTKASTTGNGFYSECMCHGSGMVEVVNIPGSFKTPDKNTITAETVTVLCKCDRGQEMLSRQGGTDDQGRERPRMAMFDPLWMQLYGVDYSGTVSEPAAPMSSMKVSDPFASDLPAYQPDLYMPKGVED